MTLKGKIFQLFDVYYSEETSYKALLNDLNKRGKLDFKKITQVLFLLAEEIEELKTPKK